MLLIYLELFQLEGGVFSAIATASRFAHAEK